MIAASSTKADEQRYWTVSRNSWVPFLKKHVFWAPLWKNRHNREIQLSKAVNVGTLPTRLQMFIIICFYVANICYCTLLLDYRQHKPALVAEFRGRTGVMSVVNMIPLVLLAGRNNPLIPLLRISFDTYNLIHRWLGRIVILEGVAHTIAWLINKVDSSGWEGVMYKLKTSPFIITGMIGTFSFILLLLHSPSPIRHAFYETFLGIHQLLAAIAVGCIYAHIRIDKLPQKELFEWVIILWVLDRFARLVRIFYRNVASTMTKVTIEALPGEACRVTMDMPRPWNFKPGTHVYIYLPTITLWTSHPFSLAWSDEVPVSGTDMGEKLPSFERELVVPTKQTMSLVICKKSGMTNTIYQRAMRAPNRTFTVRGLIEGPYGGYDSLHSYGTVMLIAGGVGITHCTGHVRDLIQGYQDGTIATRKVILVWSVRDREMLEWVRPWMDVILAMPKRREVLKILLFITRPKSTVETVSPSASISMFPGRPNFDTIVSQELPGRVGTMVVSVCGGGSISDSVRSACRKHVDSAALAFDEQCFTW